MRDIDVIVERPGTDDSEVRVGRLDGSEVRVRLRLFGYDGCEFECDHDFSLGEQVCIHIHRMGSIRARIKSRQARLIEAEFVKDCPV